MTRPAAPPAISVRGDVFYILSQQTKTSAVLTMVDATITVLIRQEATDVIATRVTDFLEGTVKVCVILCAAVELVKSNKNGDHILQEI